VAVNVVALAVLDAENPNRYANDVDACEPVPNNNCILVDPPPLIVIKPVVVLYVAVKVNDPCPLLAVVIAVPNAVNMFDDVVLPNNEYSPGVRDALRFADPSLKST
jgi:hypothetical protein